jgi:hypothetical protein
VLQSRLDRGLVCSSEEGERRQNEDIFRKLIQQDMVINGKCRGRDKEEPRLGAQAIGTCHFVW